MQWKKILKIVVIAVAIYIIFVAIEFIVFTNSMQKVTHGVAGGYDSATQAKIMILEADRKRHAQDSVKLADSSAKR